MKQALKLEKKYTYGDYLTWDDGKRWEIIEGIVYDMSPAPSRKHQFVLKKLMWQFENFLKDKTCELYFAPFDVRLSKDNLKDEDTETVVQPDIVIVCDKKKLDDKGCKGAPDIVIEILSPATASKDMKEKFFLYEKHGVKEYWIVHPNEEIIAVYKLDKNGKYAQHIIYTKDEKIPVTLLGELEIDLTPIFAE
jgi:Uma2 family endonuclease